MNEESTTRKHLKPRVPQSLPKSENLNFLSNNAFPEFPSLSWWVLTPVKLSYSRTREMNLLRCLIFKEFLFLEKDLEHVPSL